MKVEMCIHWINCDLCIEDFKNELGIWQAIRRDPDVTEEQALLDYISGYVQHTTVPDLVIGGVLEP